MTKGLKGLAFRDATVEDAASLAALDEVCFPARPYPEGMIAKHIGRGAPCQLAERARDGALAGFVMVDLHPQTGDGLLLTIDVGPDWRRRGLGTALLGLTGRAVEGAGGEVVVLTVGSRNGPARALYASVAFEEAGEIGGYYGDDDAIIMLHRDAAALAARAPAP
jgi:ribosomal protein S18 acetylase RimI-like enzyme